MVSPISGWVNATITINNNIHLFNYDNESNHYIISLNSIIKNKVSNKLSKEEKEEVVSCNNNNNINKWKCVKCTFINNINEINCKICNNENININKRDINNCCSKCEYPITEKDWQSNFTIDAINGVKHLKCPSNMNQDFINKSVTQNDTHNNVIQPDNSDDSDYDNNNNSNNNKEKQKQCIEDNVIPIRYGQTIENSFECDAQMNENNSSNSNNKKRNMNFTDDLEPKRRKYDDSTNGLSEYWEGIKERMDGYVLDHEMKVHQLTYEKEENMKKIHILSNTIKNNKKKEMELINKYNSCQKKNENLISKNMQQKKQLIEQNNNIGKLQQKNNELEIKMNNSELKCRKYNTIINESKQSLLNEKILTKQLEEKIININEKNKNMEKSLNKLQKKNEELNDKNEELNGKINLFNGKSDRINVLSIEELNKLKSELENGIKVIEKAKDTIITHKTKCIWCLENDKNVLIDPCKCVALCKQCYEKLEKLGKKICPKCQRKFNTGSVIRL